MIIDKENRFSSAQAIAVGSGVASTPGVRSTNIIDLGHERRIGRGQALFVVVLCTAAMTSSGSNDLLNVNLYSDSVEAFDSPTFRQAIVQFPAVSAAGTVLVGAISPHVLNERYIGLYYLTDADALTAGAFSAWVTVDGGVDLYTPYADAIDILG